ncbi:alpha/beta fold hydrolase [Rhodococcus fascians]|nr:alpha/beta fold hydrolase [Rhodococcus fascians]MBY4140920.1 alpha/beta fold hydrolase [Rhodococcus fascians]MBY4219584.1 alpha/beta fold hydrolase [Rhodococcus fascians]MBY4221893.1 alpha/beta fold hydrolase [Rhodococcus fascians]MBY4233894.1 alpha/beta fold hydrolase [Rhodococcus fascians]
MSGLVRFVEEPRAVLIAWHGGATSAEYFDSPGHPLHSLMRVGASLGFTVLAPSRPGYGDSRSALGDHISAATQVDLSFAVVEEVLRGRSSGAGQFLVGHSQGCVLAVRMAADPRGNELLGIEIAGTGVRHNERAVRVKQSIPEPGFDRSVLRNLLWGPEYYYRGHAKVVDSAPDFEAVDASTWSEEFTQLAREIALPVRISLGDHEGWWQSGSAGLESMRSLFRSSARVVVDEQYESGHNLSLGISALAYHLKVLAFAEECVLMRERIDYDNKKLEMDNA